LILLVTSRDTEIRKQFVGEIEPGGAQSIDRFCAKQQVPQCFHGADVRFGSASADGYTKLNLRQVHRACWDDSAFGNEFAKPFLAHDDDVRGRPCAKLCRNGIGSIALRREVLCRNCNPAALLKSGNEIIIGGGKTDGSDHIELDERWRRREEGVADANERLAC
jgi:hypothetical protein